MRIADMHPVERPRERLARLGPAPLSDAELLALVLQTGSRGRGALEVAEDLLQRFPGGSLARASEAELRRSKGLGCGKAAALRAAAELGRRWALDASGGRPRLDEPGKVWERLHEFRDRPKEHFIVLYLDARHGLLHQETVSIGTLTASLVHPREVFAPAIEKRAASIIAAHNHPSGDLTPSAEDLAATRRLAHCGRVLGIALVDHVIIGEQGYLSLRRSGRL